MSEYITAWCGSEPSALHRERIVRCRDCKYSWMNGTVCHWFESYNGFSGDPVPSPVDPDGFCAWGVRRDA